MTKDRIIFVVASLLLIIVLIVGVNIYGSDVFFNGKKEKNTIDNKETKKDIKDEDIYKEKYLKTLDYFQKINEAKIISIKIEKTDQNGKKTALVEDIETINKIYEILGNVYIEEENNNKYDLSLIYTISLENNEEFIISFDKNNIIIGEKEYSTVGVNELDTITYDVEF